MFKSLIKNFFILLAIEAVCWGLHFLLYYLINKIKDKATARYELKQKPSIPLNTIYIILGFIGAFISVISYAAIGIWIVSSWVKVTAVLCLLTVIAGIVWGYLSSYYAVVEISLTSAPSKVAPVISYMG